MQIQDALDAFYFRNKSLSPQSQEWYQKKLKMFVAWCKTHDYEQLEQITAKIIRAYLDELAARNNLKAEKRLSSYTVHGQARALRAWFNWLEATEEFEQHVQPGIGSKFPMPRIQKKTVKIFSKAEIKKLFAACEDESATPEVATRDKAILAVLLDTGIRAGELCGLTLENCFLEGDRPYILVMGKGSKEREIGLGKTSVTYLQYYLETYRLASNDNTSSRHIPAKEQHVFLGRYHQPFTPNGLGRLLRRLGTRAGVENVHPHRWRHTFACMYLLMKAGDLHSLSKLLGHTSIAITSTVYLPTVESIQARKLSQSVLDHL